jgi:hypothetical protein
LLMLPLLREILVKAANWSPMMPFLCYLRLEKIDGVYKFLRGSRPLRYCSGCMAATTRR